MARTGEGDALDRVRLRHQHGQVTAELEIRGGIAVMVGEGMRDDGDVEGPQHRKKTFRITDAGDRVYALSGERRQRLRASAQMVIIPLRSVGLAPEVTVELSLDGRPADVVTVVSDRWHYLRLQMMRDAGGPRFRRLDLRVTPDSGDASVLMVGKIEPR